MESSKTVKSPKLAESMYRETDNSSFMLTNGRGFKITREVEIGEVHFGNSDLHPHAAAMQFIGEHLEEGVYRFPTEDGAVAHIAVSFE